MRVGDLVRPTVANDGGICDVPLVEEDWKGIIVGWCTDMPVVYWNDKFPAEVEYREGLEVINERR